MEEVQHLQRPLSERKRQNNSSRSLCNHVAFDWNRGSSHSDASSTQIFILDHTRISTLYRYCMVETLLPCMVETLMSCFCGTSRGLYILILVIPD